MWHAILLHVVAVAGFAQHVGGGTTRIVQKIFSIYSTNGQGGVANLPPLGGDDTPPVISRTIPDHLPRANPSPFRRRSAGAGAGPDAERAIPLPGLSADGDGDVGFPTEEGGGGGKSGLGGSAPVSSSAEGWELVVCQELAVEGKFTFKVRVCVFRIIPEYKTSCHAEAQGSIVHHSVARGGYRGTVLEILLFRVFSLSLVPLPGTETAMSFLLLSAHDFESSLPHK